MPVCVRENKHPFRHVPFFFFNPFLFVRCLTLDSVARGTHRQKRSHLALRIWAPPSPPLQNRAILHESLGDKSSSTPEMHDGFPALHLHLHIVPYVQRQPEVVPTTTKKKKKEGIAATPPPPAGGGKIRACQLYLMEFAAEFAGDGGRG